MLEEVESRVFVFVFKVKNILECLLTGIIQQRGKLNGTGERRKNVKNEVLE